MKLFFFVRFVMYNNEMKEKLPQKIPNKDELVVSKIFELPEVLKKFITTKGLPSSLLMIINTMSPAQMRNHLKVNLQHDDDVINAMIEVKEKLEEGKILQY